MLGTMPRILWQAARLYFEKDLPVYRKPAPQHSQTFRAVPFNRLESMCSRAVIAKLEAADQGALQLQLPYGERLTFGTSQATAQDPIAKIVVHHPRFFRSLAFDGALGFAEAYMRGDWTTPELPKVLQFFMLNYDRLLGRANLLWKVRQFKDRLFHLSRKNTSAGSRRNIAAHYDLSNEFFALFLDETMTYSSARFLSAADSLEKAQIQKMDELIRLADIQEGDRVLEIGSGWGSFAVHLAKTKDVKLRTVTISQRQFEYTSELIRKERLEDRVSVELCDYRQIEGSFDRIVSVEMIEAVGRDQLQTYFKKCDELLAENGVVVIQAITIRDHHYARYCQQVDFIQRYIFPGSHVPSLAALLDASSRASRLTLQNVTPLGFDYAETLKRWRERFLLQRSALQPMGFSEDFVRMWEYYLAYCEAGFRGQFLGTFQLAFSKALNARAEEDFQRRLSVI
jgi:cyclopropane-fatty-acyl-phospholipid synthase